MYPRRTVIFFFLFLFPFLFFFLFIFSSGRGRQERRERGEREKERGWPKATGPGYSGSLNRFFGLRGQGPVSLSLCFCTGYGPEQWKEKKKKKKISLATGNKTPIVANFWSGQGYNIPFLMETGILKRKRKRYRMEFKVFLNNNFIILFFLSFSFLSKLLNEEYNFISTFIDSRIWLIFLRLFCENGRRYSKVYKSLSCKRIEDNLFTNWRFESRL